jgi:hypothetical protein
MTTFDVDIRPPGATVAGWPGQVRTVRFGAFPDGYLDGKVHEWWVFRSGTTTDPLVLETTVNGDDELEATLTVPEVGAWSVTLMDVTDAFEEPRFTFELLSSRSDGPVQTDIEFGPVTIDTGDVAFTVDNLTLIEVTGGVGSDDQTAAEVPFTPTGTIAATNVQDAIAEVASESAGGGVVAQVVAGTNVDVDSSDPTAPVVSMEVLVDADIPASIARDSEVTAAVAAEATLARNADNLTSGTVADARIASTIARDSEVTSAISTSEAGQVRDGDAAGGALAGTYPNPSFAVDMATQAELDAEAALARNGDNITSGTVADARIASTIARDSEVTAAVSAAIVATITNGDTTHASSSDALFDALALKANAANAVFTGTVTIPDGALAIADTSGLQTALDLKAPLASPALTGTPTAPTAAAGTSTTQVATTAFVNAEIANDSVELGDLPAASALTGAELAVLEQSGVASQRSYTNILADLGVVLTTGAQSIAGIKTLTDELLAEDGVFGGDGASEALTLGSTTHATRGLINLRDQTVLLSEDKTWTNTNDPFVALDLPSTRTITLNDTGGGLNEGNAIYGVRFAATVLYDENSYTFTAGALFLAQPTLKNRNGEARTLTGFTALLSAPNYTGDGAALDAGTHVGLNDLSTWGVLNAGTIVGSIVGFRSGATINTGATIATRTALAMTDATGSGTLTTQIGVDIPTLAKGGTNIGIRNASTEVCTPRANTNITAVSATIRSDAATVSLTANNSYTLTSAPTIADGQPGQRLRIINVDTADTITIQDQGTLASSNLRLMTTTVALSPRDSIDLEYNATVGDWVQTGPLCTVI